MALIKLADHTVSFESVRIENPVQEDLILIFLHEALGSIGQWKSFPEQTCKALQLNGIVYERQGHGNSDPFTKERTFEYLNDYAWIELPEFIDTIIPQDKKVILVGHSDGGTIALLYAAKFPNRVHAVVTMAAHVINETETREGIIPAIDAFRSGKLEGLRKYHGEKTNALFDAWATTWLDEEFINWDICEIITSVHAPVLAIQGSNDQYGTIRQLQLIREFVVGPVETVLLPSCGHHPHLEKQQEVIHYMQEFFVQRKLI